MQMSRAVAAVARRRVEVHGGKQPVSPGLLHFVLFVFCCHHGDMNPVFLAVIIAAAMKNMFCF